MSLSLAKHIIQHKILKTLSGSSSSTGSLTPYINYFAYQDITGIVGTTITLTSNENTDTPVAPANILNSTAVVVRSDGNPAYSGAIPLFSQRIEVVSHTGNTVTLNAIPNNGIARIYWLQRGVPPIGSEPAPKFVTEARLEFLDATYYDIYGDTLLGTMDANNNTITNLPLPTTDSEPIRNIDLDTQLKILNTVMSSGLIKGFEISINLSDPTLFDIGPGLGIIVNSYTDPANPVRTKVELSVPLVGIVDPYLATDDVVFVALDINGSVVTQPSIFTPAQARDLIVIGWIDHTGRTEIEFVGQQPKVCIDMSAQLSDLMVSINRFNVTGNVYSPLSGLQIKRSAGVVFEEGQNWTNNPRSPHRLETNADSLCSIKYYHRTSGVWVNDNPVVNEIDPNNFDNGSLVAVTAGKWTIQLGTFYAFWNVTDIQYGQMEYDTKVEAIAAITSLIEKNPYNSEYDIERFWLVVKQGATDLTDLAQAEFIDVDAKSGASSGGAGTGEANTSSNSGLTGESIVLAKSGIDLPFKSLTAGSNITITNDSVNKSLVIEGAIPFFYVDVNDPRTTGANEGLADIDGITPVAGVTRVLVFSHLTASSRGIWIAQVGAWTRATDADTIAKVLGREVHIKTGTVYGGLRANNINRSTDSDTNHAYRIDVNLVQGGSSRLIIYPNGKIDAKMRYFMTFSTSESMTANWFFNPSGAYLFYGRPHAPVADALRTGKNNGVQYAGLPSPAQIPCNGKIIGVVLSLRMGAVNQGSVTYPVTLQFDLNSQLWTSDSTKITDVDFTIPTPTPISIWDGDSAATNFRTTMTMNVNVTAGDLVGLQFRHPNGNSNSIVSRIMHAYVTLIIEES